MIEIRPIPDEGSPELKPYLTLRRGIESRERGEFVVQGGRNVMLLLKSAFPVISLLMNEEWCLKLRPSLECRRDRATAYVGASERVDAIVGHRLYQGAMAVSRAPVHPGLSAFLLPTDSNRMVVALDGLDNAENIGAIVRNCGAFGADLLMAGERTASPYLRRSVRSSMGGVFQVPILENRNLVEDTERLRKAGYRCWATAGEADGCSLSEVSLGKDTCLVFGHEGRGVSPQVLSACEGAVRVPMDHGIDSLNVASAWRFFFTNGDEDRRSKPDED